LAICSGWLLKTYLSTVTKRNSEDKTFYLHVTQPLQIAAVTACAPSPVSVETKLSNIVRLFLLFALNILFSIHRIARGGNCGNFGGLH